MHQIGMLGCLATARKRRLTSSSGRQSAAGRPAALPTRELASPWKMWSSASSGRSFMEAIPWNELCAHVGSLQ